VWKVLIRPLPAVDFMNLGGASSRENNSNQHLAWEQGPREIDIPKLKTAPQLCEDSCPEGRFTAQFLLGSFHSLQPFFFPALKRRVVENLSSLQLPPILGSRESIKAHIEGTKMARTTSVVVIGGGIVGLAITRELATRGMEVTVLEKEGKLARHQTGRNSGVIHAGPYYKPGSLKARLRKEGNHLLVKFAKEHNIAHQITGKLLIANTDGEVDRLQLIAEQARTNGVPSAIIDSARSRELEPHATGLTALHVESTGSIDYVAVAHKFASLAEQTGGELIVGA